MKTHKVLLGNQFVYINRRGEPGWWNLSSDGQYRQYPCETFVGHYGGYDNTSCKYGHPTTQLL